MAYNAKDGSTHHSASRASLHDELGERKLNKPNAEHRNPQSGVSGQTQDVSNMKIKDVVAKHGSAHEIHIKHDHAGGMHHVTSHHKGAHHKSTHGSADEAHMHAGMAAGMNTGDEEETETPDEAANENEQEEGQGAIPGMA